uniref:Uncharacterized protein n=1 Tax=Anopheles farauti TaxID=69004 RepID=A0A182QLS9_9DIPT
MPLPLGTTGLLPEDTTHGGTEANAITVDDDDDDVEDDDDGTDAKAVEDLEFSADWVIRLDRCMQLLLLCLLYITRVVVSGIVASVRWRHMLLSFGPRRRKAEDMRQSRTFPSLRSWFGKRKQN